MAEAYFWPVGGRPRDPQSALAALAAQWKRRLTLNVEAVESGSAPADLKKTPVAGRAATKPVFKRWFKAAPLERPEAARLEKNRGRHVLSFLPRRAVFLLLLAL